MASTRKSEQTATTESRILDLGCGRDKLPGAIGMDANPRSVADIIHDIDKRPWPLEDSTFDHVRAQDVLEHVADFIGVMEELHRVCRDGATIDVRMPFMSSVNYHTDPTHRRAGTSRTFDYFDPERELGRYAYTAARFEIVKFRYARGRHRGVIGALFLPFDLFMVPLCRWAHMNYEQYFAYVYPMQEITYSLRVVKR